MDGWTYKLTGFDDDFLELRHVSFAEPMPTIRVCVICGVVPPSTMLLPCSHALCSMCMTISASEGCPLDGKVFALADVQTISFKRADLDEHRVLCGGCSEVPKCTFGGKLSDLKSHMTRYGSDMVRCGKCCVPLARGLAVSHYRQCSGNYVAPDRFNAEANDAAAALASNARRLGGVVNALVGRVDQLERDLHVVKKICHGREGAQSSKVSSLRLPENKATSVTVISGPYRAASRPGVLITTCKFSGVCAVVESLNREKRMSSDTYMLGGYTFRLDCEFLKNENKTSVRFILFLCDGEWDSCLEWPFSKKVTLIVMHPTDAEKDIRLPLLMKGDMVVKRPGGSSWNYGQWSDKVNWETIEMQRFVYKGSLYINVEFE
ncbi:hypothetical protein HPB50_006149 [Hyalomma asiaticum]|uniref:Uncharacterized protein n=1 Tax=Hyalomma asiaticum TaxID=266040 RepID=A0ACB7TF77_HYAAI|nr:hypothetical protein HPB50_006149 [Hyalomma asiaticum]